jgi:pseudo-rSAM protein
MHSGKKEPEYWLFLEPYVHVSLNKDSVLFYNSLSGERFEIESESRAGRLSRELLLPENGYVAGVETGDLNDDGVKELVRKLRDLFMGELLKREWSTGKPVNILPEPHFKSLFTKEMLAKPEAKDLIDFDNYIHEIVFYINSSGRDRSRKFSAAPKQFVFPGDTLDRPAELPLNKIEAFIQDIIRFKITHLHVSGSDIFHYSEFEALDKIITRTGIPVTYNLTAAQYDPVVAGILLNNRAARLSVHFTFPLNTGEFNSLLTELTEKNWFKRVDFHFLVSSQEELAAAREVISATGLPHAYLSPFYTGDNFDFFRDAIFITKEDILASTPSQNQVYSRISVNESDFGRFIILPDGIIYANLNDPPAGELGSQRLEELIVKEMLEGVSWTRTRKSVAPCSRCLYYFLCPPVSSYELIMKRFNFCDVFE